MLEDPATPDRRSKTIDLMDRALATSGDDGCVFDPAGRLTHLLDPRTARSPRRYRLVSVVAPDATATCALSTAFALMPVETIAATLRGLPPVEASLPSHDGTAALLRGG